jgi:hypothetical protein
MSKKEKITMMVLMAISAIGMFFLVLGAFSAVEV